MVAQTVKTKIYYIDNLRVLLTILVVLHHIFITYGAPGGWYYREPTTNKGSLIAMTLFVATNQAFFMGFFFFLSALFTQASLEKKGSTKFVTDRLKRLGIPLLFYSFILSPCMNYLVYRYGKGGTATFGQYLGGYDDWIDFGVLWFVAALLVFTLLYIVIRQRTTASPRRQLALPGNNTILLFAFVLGIISFLVRIVFPVGWVLKPVGFQLAHFTQYVALFALGIAASRNRWLDGIAATKGKRWLILSIILVFIIFPSVYGASVATHSPIDSFQGKGSWQSLLAAVWEQVTGFSIIMAMLCISKAKWNYTTPRLQTLSRAAFATYIIHPLIIISVTLLLKGWNADPAVKLLVAAPVIVPVAFLAGILITKIPGVKNIV